jgi:Tol biopolymer transport system component
MLVRRSVVAGLLLALTIPLPAAAQRESHPATGHEETPPAAHLPPPPGTTSLVSTRPDGKFPAGPSAQASISANGRWVAFTSAAPDLVPGDTNEALDVFVLDRSNGSMTRLPLPGGAPVAPGGRAYEPSMAANGSVVAFVYEPPAPASTVGSGPRQVVLAWDRRTGQTEVISQNVRGGVAPGSDQPSVSADGRYVAYVSTNNLIDTPDPDSTADVFRYDRQTKTTLRVSLNSGGGWIVTSTEPSISGDGGRVAYTAERRTTDLEFPTVLPTQVFVRDVAAGTDTMVSADAQGREGRAAAGAPAISSDGRFVAFESASSNFVAEDTNEASDVFLRELATGAITLVSITPEGRSGRGASGQPAISADGRVVAFASNAGGVVPAAISARLPAEVYARDVVAGETILVSVGTDGKPGGGHSVGPAIGGLGRFVAFASDAPTLVAGDDNKLGDVFLRDLPPVPSIDPPEIDFGARATGTEAMPSAAVLANAGWGPLDVSGAVVQGSAAADFPVAFDGCAGARLYRGDACTVSVGFVPSTSGDRTAVLAVEDAFTGSPRTVRLRGTGSLAGLVLDPPIGPPGMVTVVSGSGFPPGAGIRLAWSQGITPTLAPIVADADGTFTVGVLVFHKDIVGPRRLVASALEPGAFPPVEVEMRVVQSSMTPPAFGLLRRGLDMPIVMLLRG